MSKDKISDYSTTANSNTDIGGINVDEGCAPSGINDAIRTLMAQLKTWQSGGQDIYIHPAGSASAPSITATGDTNTGVFFPAADTVGISTGGTERARVDSSGNLGLGVTPSANSLAGSGYRNLEIGSINGYGVFAGSYEMYLLGNAYYNSGWKYANSSKAASRYIQTDGIHAWASAPTGTAGSAITFTAVAQVSKDNTFALQGGTSGAGTGIAFPATQSASSDANTLDDYEEGTWTPVLSFGFGATGQTYSNQQGYYTKIGNLVTATCYFSFSNKGSSTGTARIEGLPFTVGKYSTSGLYLNEVSFSGMCCVYAEATTTYIPILQQAAAGGSNTSLTQANFTNNSAMMINISYRV